VTSIQTVGGESYDWGSLLVQGLLAFLTLVTLIWTIRAGARDRRERLAYEERLQASQVAAWEEQTVFQADGSAVPRDLTLFQEMINSGEARERRFLHVHNGSDGPVFDVVVMYDDISSPDTSFKRQWHHRVLPSSSGPRTAEVNLTMGCGAVAADTLLAIEFRDGAGRYWFRDTQGTLHRRQDLDALAPGERHARWFMGPGPMGLDGNESVDQGAYEGSVQSVTEPLTGQTRS
jgi:hypothetical protein